MSNLNLLSGLKPEPVNTNDEDEGIEAARARLEAIRSESLDDLRNAIEEIPTSQLVVMLAVGNVPLTDEEERLPQEAMHLIVVAGLLAISDELDRRVPPTKTKTPAT